jgi:hypothetical protein
VQRLRLAEHQADGATGCCSSGARRLAGKLDDLHEIELIPEPAGQ